MSSENQGPLSIELALSDTKTAVPLVAHDHMTVLRLVNVTQKTVDRPNGAGQGAQINFEFTLVEPVPSADGAGIVPGAFGSTIFETVPLYAKADAKNPNWFKEKISKILDALLGTGDPGNTKGKPPRPNLSAQLVPDLIGKTVVAKIKVDTYEGVTRNKIDTYTFPGDVNM